ncbi:MAG TPA: hypothetical protein DCY35_08470 [Prolixibacteraceae bacterium]|nr:hypothetical protein [Prolixibacteraceae bacterium]
MTIGDIFGKYEILNGKGLEIKAGTLNLMVKRFSMGWGFHVIPAVQPFDGVFLGTEIPELEVSESDLFQTGRSDKLVVTPALPLKPVVLKNSGMRILPGQSMRFFVKVPLSLQFYHTDTIADNFITEYPLIRLSDTWFGEPDEGETAFALGRHYQKDPELLDLMPWEIICPVLITNHSTLLLEVQRLIIRVNNLAILSTSHGLMTNIVDIEYKGKEQISSATYRVDRNVHGDNQHQLASPRSLGAKSSLMINFHFIKNIYQI